MKNLIKYTITSIIGIALTTLIITVINVVNAAIEKDLQRIETYKNNAVSLVGEPFESTFNVLGTPYKTYKMENYTICEYPHYVTLVIKEGKIVSVKLN